MRRTLMIMSAALALAVPQIAWAQASSEQAAVDRATAVVEQLRAGPGAPTNMGELLRRARGIMIFPELVKAGFIVGAQAGSGVLLSRNPATNTWSYPAFYVFGAGSLGLQAGAQLSRIVFIIMNEKALNALMSDEFKVGAEAGIAIVTVGAGAEASTTSAAGTDIYAFVPQAMGLYGGIALEGGIIKPRLVYNQEYYSPSVRAQDIVLGLTARNPGADGLRNALARASGG
ncbi:MAG TPA: lipid-binding SYLF domain-containing protein [Stellaceae bacterium]|nr:lipid-binding SYLF domain-containing protein [Stellaceae bacterium]